MGCSKSRTRVSTPSSSRRRSSSDLQSVASGSLPAGDDGDSGVRAGAVAEVYLSGQQQQQQQQQQEPSELSDLSDPSEDLSERSLLLPGMVPPDDAAAEAPAAAGGDGADVAPQPEPAPEPEAPKSNHFSGPKPDPMVQVRLEGHKRKMHLRRKKEVLRLVPIHLSVLQRAEPDSGWTEAVISLYRHVLPSLGRSHIDSIIRNNRTDTLLFVRSARAKPDGVPKEEDGPGGPGTNVESQEPDSASSSSFSDSDVEEDDSDEDDEDDDDDEDEDEEDDPDDVDDLLDEPESPDGSLTAKQRIIGAITWEPIPNAIRPRCRVLQLTLIGCRTKYQGFGIASRLMRECKDPLVCGMDYDVITTFADHNAVPFFAKQGFNDDKILNSRYIAYLDDDWDQSILMSYTRPRAAVAAADKPIISGVTSYGQQGESSSSSSSETKTAKLTGRIEAWKAARMEEYSSQLLLVEQLVNEVSTLQDTLGTVEGRLSHLNRDYAALRRRNILLEQELSLAKAPAVPSAGGGNPLATYVPSNNGMLFGSLDPRCAEFEAVREMLAGPQSSDSCGESAGAGRLHLQRVTKSCFPPDHPILSSFVQHRAHLAPGGLQQQLFFGADPEQLTSWFEHGFPKTAPAPSEAEDPVAIYGKGFYFSKRADKAHYYSQGGGKLLVAIVAMGSCTTVITPDPKRTAPPPLTVPASLQGTSETPATAGGGAGALHSMLVPGRPRPSQRVAETAGGMGAIARANGTASGEGEEEYVIFDGRQVLPLYLIDYTSAPLKNASLQKPTTGVSRDVKPNPFEELLPEPEPEPEPRTPKGKQQHAAAANVNEKKKDPLLQKLGAAAAAAAAAASSAAPPGSGDGSAMTPRHDRRDCTDAELLSALRKIRAAEAEAAERGGGEEEEAARVLLLHPRAARRFERLVRVQTVTTEYGWAVSEKRLKRLLKEDNLANQLLELAASPPPPGLPDNDNDDDGDGGGGGEGDGAAAEGGGVDQGGAE